MAAKEHDTRKLLLESTQKIVEAFQAGRSEAAQSAFSSFRRGLTHASQSSCAGTSQSLIGELEPKDVMIRFLVDFHGQRRIFRKQIVSAVAELLQTDSWFYAFRKHQDACNDLPDDLVTLLVDADREDEEEKQEQEVHQTQANSEFSSSAVRTDGTLLDPWSLPTTGGTLIDPWTAQASNQSATTSDPEKRRLSQESRQSQRRMSQDSVSSGERKRGPRLSLVRDLIEKAAGSADTALPIRANGPTVSGLAPEVQKERSEVQRERLRSRKSTAMSIGDLDSALDVLEEGCEMIRELGFSAVDLDVASSAFESFRRGVSLVSSSSMKEQDRDVIERMEPKPKILEFLVDMYERYQKYRSRVTSLLNRLLAYDGWRGAADDFPAVHAVLHDYEDMKSLSTVSSAGTSLNLNTVAATAAAHGGIGALYVQIIAGYNLVAADSNGTSDPYVKVTLGSKTHKTPIICDTLNPKWNAHPFAFEVPSLDSIIKFEVRDSDFFKDDTLGEFDVRAAEVPIDTELSLVRRALTNVPHGEIELKLLLFPGKELHHVPEPWQSAPKMPAAAIDDPQARCPTESISNTEVSAEQSANLNTLWTPWGPPPAHVAPQTSTPTASPTTAFRATTKSTNPFGSEENLTPRSRKETNPFTSEGNRFVSEGDGKSATIAGADLWSEPVSPRFAANPFASKAPPTRKPTDPFTASAPTSSAPTTPRKSVNPFPLDRAVSPPPTTGYPGADIWKDPQNTTPNVSPRTASGDPWASVAPPSVATRPANPFIQGARNSFPVKARNPFEQRPTK